MRRAQLSHHEAEKDRNAGTIDPEEILPDLRTAHGTQRNEVTKKAPLKGTLV
jgi:hypothetical protein